MAERGKLIPVAVRLEIRRRILTETVRQIAAALRLSKTTVHKYGTNYLQPERKRG